MQIKKGGAVGDAYNKIKRMMYYKEIVPGQKLVIRELATKLGIGATPILYALNRFHDSGLVEYRENRGYFLEEITKREAIAVYEARQAIETWAVPAIIENITPTDIHRIREQFRNNKLLLQDHRLAILSDSHFHLKLFEFANSPILYRILSGLFDEIILKYRPEYMGQDIIKSAVEGHRECLKALQEKDAVAAIHIIKNHIQQGCEYVIRTLEKLDNLPLASSS